MNNNAAPLVAAAVAVACSLDGRPVGPHVPTLTAPRAVRTAGRGSGSARRIATVAVSFWFLPIFTLLLSCTKIGRVAEQGMAPAGAPELAHSRRWYDSVHQWERSLWYRSPDSWFDFPVHVVISTSGRACVTDQGGYERALEGTLFYCRTFWRYPRRARLSQGVRRIGP